MTKYIDDHATAGHDDRVTRDAWFYPFVYVGYPDIDHRIVYADTLGEAARRAPTGRCSRCAPCEAGWELGLRSPPWAVYRQVPGSSCR